MTLRNHSRTYDVLARYDATLFAAILPHSPLNDAVRYADKIMQEVGSTTFSDPSFPTEARLSVGIVACQNGSAHGADFVLGEAMRGLLQAKSLPEERLVARNIAED
jgi:diguanylate cyclase (GGDEF)-like protein